jgi:hypothetical protein
VSTKAIETLYRGCRFRSRLEARWACFWDHLETRWEYEPQGFVVAGRPYLPDFRLPNGTWVEVKGSEDELDHDLMSAAAGELPGGADPRLLILGPMPEPPGLNRGNWAWLGFGAADFEGETIVTDSWWEFGDEGLPWPAVETSCAPPPSMGGDAEWLVPVLNMVGDVSPLVVAAYRAGRSARFEHGESGATR